MRFATLALFVFVSATHAEEFHIVTWNLKWFNDHDKSDDTSSIGRDFSAPSEAKFKERVIAMAESLAQLKPVVVALQEIENDKVVQAIADQLASAHNLQFDVAFVQGKDTYTGQDVAFLVSHGISTEASRFDYPFSGSSQHKDVSKHAVITANIAGEPVQIVAVHLITKEAQRMKQARTLRAWTEDAARDKALIILGDFNVGLKFESTFPTSDIGTIRGLATTTLVDDLFDVHELLSADERNTHVSDRPLDRVLVSSELRDSDGLRLVSAKVRRDLAIRGSEDGGGTVDYDLSPNERDVSDHYPVVATFTTDDAGSGGGVSPDIADAIRAVEKKSKELADEIERLKELVGEGQ